MKILLVAMMMGLSLTASAQKITFEKTVHDFGTFKKDHAVQKYSFKFTNTGDKPLIVHRVAASCGCTTPKWTKMPIKPGESGTIDVEYNGSRFLPGHFKKSITVNTNGAPEMLRLYIEGDMEE